MLKTEREKLKAEMLKGGAGDVTVCEWVGV
jgi:hypothetical protein